jgi:hypothetical protein
MRFFDLFDLIVFWGPDESSTFFDFSSFGILYMEYGIHENRDGG